MANPQLEKGYVQIADEIQDAFIRTNIPGRARQCLDLIIRKTYGYGKKEDMISLSQFSEFTRMSERSVCKAINKLIEMNLITKRKNDPIPFYSFQKDYDKWGVPSGALPKRASALKGTAKSCERGVPKRADTINNNTINNNKYCQSIKNEIDILLKEYSPEEQKIIQKCFEALKSVRQTYTVSPNILKKELLWWKKYSHEVVIKAIMIYLEKDCASQGKGERYLRGIIRNEGDTLTAEEMKEKMLLEKIRETGSFLEAKKSLGIKT